VVLWKYWETPIVKACSRELRKSAMRLTCHPQLRTIGGKAHLGFDSLCIYPVIQVVKHFELVTGSLLIFISKEGRLRL
jgi:hypothetical protein